MASDRKPSGLPSGRIVRQIYGSAEVNVDQRVGSQHEGFVGVRRNLFIASAVVAVVVAAVAIAGNPSSASGMAALMLGPLLFVLFGSHVAVILTRPKQPHARDDRS